MRYTLSLCILLALPLAAWAQTPLIEAEAVRLGLARSDLSDLDQAEVRVAQADVLAAGQLPNPTLSYSRDRVGGSPATVEQSWMLSQAFDLSGKRKLHREAAERRVEVVGAGNAVRRNEFAAAIRRAFHEVLLRQESIRASEAWVQRFTKVEGLVGKHARAGEASGYDQRRLARERQSALARLAAERAELGRAQANLVALIGTSH